MLCVYLELCGGHALADGLWGALAPCAILLLLLVVQLTVRADPLVLRDGVELITHLGIKSNIQTEQGSGRQVVICGGEKAERPGP